MAFNSRCVAALIVVEEILVGIIDSLPGSAAALRSRCALGLP